MTNSVNQLKEKFDDIGIAKIDMTRFSRTGVSEVIFGAGKTVEQTIQIARHMIDNIGHVLITKTFPEVYEALVKNYPQIRFNPTAKTVSFSRQTHQANSGSVCLINAGTSDLPVSEEAYETLKFFGITANRIHDVGVAGIHRVLSLKDAFQASDIIIVAAGMEGALPSVVSGLVKCPVIAVPTSVGYGAAFEGLAALLAMMNSCAPGVTVVNIDNGFGAAVAALKMINRIYERTVP